MTWNKMKSNEENKKQKSKTKNQNNKSNSLTITNCILHLKESRGGRGMWKEYDEIKSNSICMIIKYCRTLC